MTHGVRVIFALRRSCLAPDRAAGWRRSPGAPRRRRSLLDTAPRRETIRAAWPRSTEPAPARPHPGVTHPRRPLRRVVLRTTAAPPATGAADDDEAVHREIVVQIRKIANRSARRVG